MEPRRGRATVVVMAKAPVVGAVKTRLLPALAAEEATNLYHCFLLDTLDLVRGIAAAPVLAYAPAEAHAWFAALCADFALMPQTGVDLGARMAAVFANLFAQGTRPVVLLGADAPTLPADLIKEALATLDADASDVVLVPVADGGYCLIGLAAPQPALFSGMPWSTADVLARTLDRASALGLRAATLAPWWDVDTPDDLRRLASAAPEEGGPARHTRAYLAARAAAGHAIC
jgi:uncharacterized protein